MDDTLHKLAYGYVGSQEDLRRAQQENAALRQQLDDAQRALTALQGEHDEPPTE